MKEKNILKIREIEALIAKSKAAGKFNLLKLVSNENNLLDVGDKRSVQIFIGTKKDFEEINQYLLEQQNETSGEQFDHIETLRTVIWHFRQLQEQQNEEKMERYNLNKYGLHKVPMPQTSKNSEGEECDYESRVVMKEFFSTIECFIEDKTELRNTVEKYVVYLPKKQQLIINETLDNVHQSEICIKYKMSKASVSNLYNRAIKKLIELIQEN